MPGRIGLGPVFEFEWLVAARRWREYAFRALFVLGLLLALIVVYQSRADRMSNGTLKAQAQVGQAFFFGIVSVQMALIMLASPAATAGAICLDKARGTLLHVMVTDLSDSEIVLGKLAARLLPTLMLVACALPVMALGTLLGGIDPIALMAAFIITIGVAVLGCSLALTLSVWGSKTHEVLLATYSLWVVWLLAHPMVGQASAYVPAWADWMLWPLQQLAEWDPYRVAFAPYIRPGTGGLPDALKFLGGTLAASLVLAGLCIWQLRPVVIRQWGRSKPEGGLWRRFTARFSPIGLRIPSPRLDFNPVLWREWHRNRPSGWTRILWGVYFGVGGAFGVMAWFGSAGVGAWVNGLMVSVGLLMLSVSAATSLAEERVRGSLDVLMSTPLPTLEIVSGKWLGTARLVPFLGLLPFLVVVPRIVSPANGHTSIGMAVSAIVLTCLILAQGLAIVSLGLGLATWIPKVGRVVALTVSAHVMMTVGWLFIGLLLFSHQNFEGIGMASPFYGAGNLTFWMEQGGGPREWIVEWGAGWAVVYAGVAAGLFFATLSTFNRCLGRLDGGLYTPPRVLLTKQHLDPGVVFLEPSAGAAQVTAEVS
ncbi:MAG: ABC transporter permease subunit [Isosphaeraceae bacterium]